MSGSTVTGTGTYSKGQPTSVTFEGRPARAVTVSIVSNLQTQGRTVAVNSSVVGYIDAEDAPLGWSSSVDYLVMQTTAPFPRTVRVGDTAVQGTAIRYSNSSKTTRLGTSVISYAVQADTTNSVLVVSIRNDVDNNGRTTASSSVFFRLSDSGFVRVRETSSDSTTDLTFTYN